MADLGATFNKLPKWAKIALPIGGVLLAYVGYKKYEADKAANAAAATTAAATTATTPTTTTDGTTTGGGGFSGGGGGGGGEGPLSQILSAIQALQPTAAATTTTATTGTGTGTPATTGTSAATGTAPVSAVNPSPTPIAQANLSPAAASAAVNAGTLTPEAALQSEVPASAETAAQRHAQEVANKPLRQALKG
jgi:hypothetical protein